MSSEQPAVALPDLLQGTWTVEGTNFPMWLDGQRLRPTFTYRVISDNPLVLADDVAYSTPSGEIKHILGTDKLVHDGFVWRGKGLQKLISSRWTVEGNNPEATIVVIRFEKTLFTPAGIDVLVRDGFEVPELRALIARNSPFFGLAPEDLASLTWLYEKR